MAIQKRENDLVLGTFGRGFYVLDDYSPLRNLTKEALEQDGKIFPIKKSLAYIEANPLVDDVNHYPYNIEVYQEIDSPNRIVLNVEDSMDEASGTGFSPSANESCFGQPKLYVKVEDAATDGITSAFSATAEVRITVKPE